MKKKKTIGIITLNGYFNFGNRLQNFALTKILEKKGYDVYTLWNKTRITIIKDFIKSKLFFIKKYNRYRSFYRFSKDNMKEMIVKQNKIKKVDIFAIGSDQVWNYKLMDKDHTWFEAPTGKRVFSYSASLGTSDFPQDFGCRLKEQLIKYDHISVREKKGKELLDKLLPSKKIELIIDPTLILNLDEWDKIAKKPKKSIPQKYIFIYFLGDIKKEYYNEIEKYSIENQCELINILDSNSDFFDIGPQEFIYLIKNAHIICTDSFHACVFSFKYNRPFIIFKRTGEGISNDMYSRLENLLELFNLENREYNGVKITNENVTHDYTLGYNILENEILKSEAFLQKALDIKE